MSDDESEKIAAWYALYELLRQSLNSGSWPEGVTLADIEQAKKLLRL